LILSRGVPICALRTFPWEHEVTFKKPSREELLSSCDQVSSEDGTDPRFFLRKPSRGVRNRKALQLCEQIGRTLSMVLAGECGDEVLRDLTVESVVPAPNSLHLLVTLTWPPSAHQADASEILEHVHRAGGKLRTEIAAAIHRKHVPELVFRIQRMS
jgi:ribosome-binding factor A